MSTLTLYQSRPMFGLPNASPFCMKLETYLRLANLPYQTVTVKSLRASPTGKAPFIDDDGKIVADSGLIIAHLEAKYGHPVDGRLTLAQRAASLALQRMIEEHLYWVAVYMRWVDPETRAAGKPHLREMFGLPAWLTPLIARLSARGIAKVLRNQGLGRHPPDIIWRMGIADVQATAHWLGQRPWGFGETPTVIDACLAAFIGNILKTPWENPLTAATRKHTNLASHIDRLMARCFPKFAD